MVSNSQWSSMSLTYGTSTTATPLGFSTSRTPRDEAVQVRDVGEDVVGVEDVRPQPLGGQPAGELGGEELLAGRHPVRSPGDRATFRAGSMPSTGTPARR